MLALEIAGRAVEEWSAPTTAMRVQEWRDREGRLCAIGYAEGRRGWLEWPGLATFAFTDGSGEVVAIPHLSARNVNSDAIEDIFHRTARPIILQAFGWEALHASAVLIGQGVVGFCGLSESGKSTLAYALGRLGHPHLADDALLLDFGATAERGNPVARLLPFSPRLRPSARLFFGLPDPSPAQAFPHLVAPVRDRSEELKALFVLDRNGTPAPRVTPMASAAAFTHVLTHAYCFNPVAEHSKRRIIANYLSLVSRVPVFRLEFSGELRHLDRMAEAVLEEAEQLTAAS